MDTQINDKTFIVRLWSEDAPDESDAWQGVIERIGSESHGAFQTLGELTDWLRYELANVGHDGRFPDRSAHSRRPSVKSTS